MVGLDPMDHAGVNAVAACQLCAKDRVSAFDLMVDRFPEVVQRTAAPGDVNIPAEFMGDHRCQVGCLYGVSQLVLAVAVPVLQPPQCADNLWVQPGGACLRRGG